MPELPEVQALATTLTARLAGLRLAGLDVTAVSALKTASPPHADLVGLTLREVRRRGKFLCLCFASQTGPEAKSSWLVIHLARAGWLRLSTTVPSSPARPGRGPLMARLTFVNEDGEPAYTLDLTEAGTRKGASMYVVTDPNDVPGIAALGPDALEFASAADLATALRATGATRIKNAIRDQRVLAGIGNAYSDEILHAARLSPYAAANRLTDEQYSALLTATTAVLTAATQRAEAADPTSMKAEKKRGLQIHGRAGEPCPVCATTIAEVALADRAFAYCPTCQTDGKLLADRRMSRLLK